MGLQTMSLQTISSPGTPRARTRWHVARAHRTDQTLGVWGVRGSVPRARLPLSRDRGCGGGFIAALPTMLTCRGGGTGGRTGLRTRRDSAPRTGSTPALGNLTAIGRCAFAAHYLRNAGRVERLMVSLGHTSITTSLHHARPTDVVAHAVTRHVRSEDTLGWFAKLVPLFAQHWGGHGYANAGLTYIS